MRPSLWVEPVGAWGRGAVQLVEIPTADETHDNIVAYWVPAEPVTPDRPLAYAYRLHWNDDEPYRAKAACVCDSFVGIGGVPGQDRPKDMRKFVVDFTGGKLGEYGPQDGVEAVIAASRGELGAAGAYPVVGRPGLFRAVFDLKVSGAEPVDLRLFLKRGDEALTETWLSQFFPQDPRIAGPV
jgi:glucans biosynthesis protein